MPKYATKREAEIPIIGETSLDFLRASLRATYVTKPTPIPLVIEYVNGITAIVRNAGIPRPSSSHGMRLTRVTILQPTTIRAGATACGGTTPTAGHEASEARKSRPTTTLVRPVLPPSAMPAALSTYVVFEDAPHTPPNAAASE